MPPGSENAKNMPILMRRREDRGVGRLTEGKGDRMIKNSTN